MLSAAMLVFSASRSGGGGDVPPTTFAALRFQASDISSTETGFRIETRIKDSGSAWGVDVTLGSLAGTGLAIDETLSLYSYNEEYQWQIVPFNGAGDGSVYGPYYVWTKPETAPSNLAATPVSSSQINLAWTAGDPVTGYRIYAALHGGTLAPITTVSAATLSYNLTGRAASEAYDIAVVSYNDNSAYGWADSETAKDVVGAFATATTLPAVESITVGQSTTTVVFSEAMTVGANTNVPVLTMSGGAITLSAPTGIGTNTWVYTNSRNVGFSETGTGAYTQAGDGLKAGTRLLVTFSGVALVNSSSFGAITYLSGVSVVGDTTAGNAINTTGASLLVVVTGGQNVSSGCTDSKGNTWTQIEQAGGGLNFKMFYCLPPSDKIGTSHTFASSSESYNFIAVVAFSGIDAFDKSISAFTAASVTSFQPGSQTPTSAPCLSVLGLCTTSNLTSSSSYVCSGYTLGPNTPAVSTVNHGGAIFYAVLTNTAANNPTATWTGVSPNVMLINMISN